ncbi:MAG: response regulator, partial [Desulfobacterales bacterium]|nr:response regulator [Desulfobacterales bacterium]
YFENAALGMSMEYGLGFSIQAIQKRFTLFIQRRIMGEKFIYSRLAFVDMDGKPLMEAGAPAPHPLGPGKGEFKLDDAAAGYYIHSRESPSRFCMFLTLPYHFKGRQVGRVIAWIIPRNVLPHYLLSPRPSKLTGLLCGQDHFLRHEFETSPGEDPEASVDGVSILSEERYARILPGTMSGGDLSFRQPIPDTAFHLVQILPSGAVFGSVHPGWLLLAMAFLILLLIVGAPMILRIITYNVILRTRVDESRKRENEIAAKNIELKAEMEEREKSEKKRRELEAKLRRAQKMEAIGALAGGVAHDLNNILSGLVSYPELLLLELPEESHLRQPILTIKRSGEKAAQIVQDLLTLARRGVAVTEVVNLNQIIREYLSSPEFDKLMMYHPEIRIETWLDDALLNIMGSPVHLSKTIMNLLSNAAEATPGKGVIRVKTENRYIDTVIGGYDDIEEGDYVVFTIIDSGIGIASQDLDRIFEPFFTKKVMGRSGTGLGMSVVWGAVKDHRGYIDVRSRENHGTTFTLYFPVTRKEVVTRKEDVEPGGIAGSGEAILVVDDVKEQREIASRMLTRLGYLVESAPSGEEAILRLQEKPADLVLLDMIMAPGIDGLETYRQMLKIRPGQKAVIASGYSETKRAKEAQDLGAGEYIKKPYSMDKIGRAVKRELKKK